MSDTQSEQELKPLSEEALQTLDPGAAEKACEIIYEFITNLDGFKIGNEKANSASILNMNQMVLLAGGTLTMIFTVIGVMGGNLRDAHVHILHIPLILSACWLLVAVIIVGVSCNNVLIKLGVYQNAEDTARMADIRLRIKLLLLTRIKDTSAIPKFPLIDKLELKKRTTYRTARILGGATYAAFIAAFILLLLFLQSNVDLMLSLK